MVVGIVKMRFNINIQHSLTKSQQLTKTHFYLFWPKINIETTIPVILERGKKSGLKKCSHFNCKNNSYLGYCKNLNLYLPFNLLV